MNKLHRGHKNTKSSLQEFISRMDEMEAGGLLKLIANSDVSTCTEYGNNQQEAKV